MACTPDPENGDQEATISCPPPSNQRLPEQEYDFVEEPAGEFFCAVSLELLREPQQTDCCGHHLSVEVAQRLQGEGKPCPMCQHPHFTTHPDIFHRRKIQQLTVHCQYKNSGCEWTGELGNLKDHVIKCPKQPWQCTYCTFSGLRDTEEDHLSGCGQFPVPCPNGCEAGSVERCSLEQHLLECPLQLVGCEYAAMGCAVRLPRREMREHIRQSGQEHLLKMCAANLTVSRELSRKVEEKEQQIAELQEEMRRMEGRVEERMKELEERMNRNTEGVLNTVEKKLMTALDEKNESVKNMVDEVKGIVQSVQQEVVGIRREVYSGKIPPLEYTIRNFSSLKAQNKEWRSPPFYSHLGGYKMCIGVWANGYSVAKGLSVSLKFYVMRDANSEGLRWPAKLPVTIHLLNQSSRQWERGHTGGAYSARAKPSSEYEESSGYMQYLPHSELSAYLKDDCVNVRVTSFSAS